MKRVFLFLILLLALSATCLAQTGQTQDAPLDSKRVGFAPTVVRHANLAAQDVTTWSGLPGQATVATGVKAPDGTTTAATLSIVSPNTGGKLVYSASHTLQVGDWLLFGVWVRAVSLTAPITTLDAQAVARISATDPTSGYQFDADNLNYRDLFASGKADTEWQWVTSAAKVISVPATQTATVQFELQCSINKTLSFYAPVLHHVPVGQATDAEAASLLRNLYSVPDGVPAGNVALLRGQALYCYNAGVYAPCSFGSSLGGDPVIEDATPTLEFRDTDAADFLIDVNANTASMRFIGSGSLIILSQAISRVDIGFLRVTNLDVVSNIRDTNSFPLIIPAPAGTPVNQFTLANADTGNSPRWIVSGTDSNIGMSIEPKGNGTITIPTGSGSGIGLSVDHSSANSSGAFFRGRTGGTNRIEILPFDLGGSRVGGWINMSTTGASGIGSGGVGAAAWVAYADVNGAYFPDALAGDIVYRGVNSGTRLIFGNDGSVNSALAISGNLIGVNKGTSIGAQLHVNSGSTSRRAFVANNPSGTTVPIAEFRVNESAVITVKSNGYIIGMPKVATINGGSTGNVGVGLDSLHTFNLPAGSLTTNGDYVEVIYSGTFGVNDNNKRIVINFGGVVVDDSSLQDQDGGSWEYRLTYVRLSATSVRFITRAVWGILATDSTPTLSGNGRTFTNTSTITVSDLSANAMTMLVQGEATSNDDIVQSMSIIRVTQIN